MNIKMFEGNNLPNELLLIARQKTEIINSFENKSSADTKLSKTQISKIIQSGGFLGLLLTFRLRKTPQPHCGFNNF